MGELGYEAVAVGDRGRLGTAVVDRDGAIAFAAQYDPQPFHLDEAAGLASPLGGLAASGWYSCALFMRLLADNFLNRHKSMGSPGVTRLRWVKPVLVGDSLTCDYAVTGLRPSSRGDRGYVEMDVEITNQRQETVLTLSATLILGR